MDTRTVTKGKCPVIPIGSRSRGNPTVTRDPLKVGLPDTLEFYQRGSSIEIVRKWLGWRMLFLTILAVFWNGFLVTWYMSIPVNVDLTTVLSSLVHVAVGVWLTYYVVAGWFNRTHTVVNQHKITVRHRPVPWFGNKEISVSNVEQLYTKEKVSHSRTTTSVTYEVHAHVRVCPSRSRVRHAILVGGLESSEQARFIEQEIEKYLATADAPVKGEYGRSLG